MQIYMSVLETASTNSRMPYTYRWIILEYTQRQRCRALFHDTRRHATAYVRAHISTEGKKFCPREFSVYLLHGHTLKVLSHTHAPHSLLSPAAACGPILSTIWLRTDSLFASSSCGEEYSAALPCSMTSTSELSTMVLNLCAITSSVESPCVRTRSLITFWMC